MAILPKIYYLYQTTKILVPLLFSDWCVCRSGINESWSMYKLSFSRHDERVFQGDCVNLQSFNNIIVFWFFHMLNNTWSVIFILYILVAVWYFNIMVVVCNLLKTREAYHLFMYF